MAPQSLCRWLIVLLLSSLSRARTAPIGRAAVMALNNPHRLGAAPCARFLRCDPQTQTHNSLLRRPGHRLEPAPRFL